MAYPWAGKNIEVACFDMDGTLLNSGDFGVVAITRAFEELISRNALPGMKTPPPPELIRAQIGKPPSSFYRELLPASLQERAHELHLATTKHEKHLLANGTGKLFEGAREVLAKLKGAKLKLMLVSNCSQGYLDAVSETFALAPLLDYAQCVGDKSIEGRTKAALVAAGLKQLGVRRGIMVGDRSHDHEAASASGLWFIACTYGYGTKEELAQADAHIDDIRRLPGMLGI